MECRFFEMNDEELLDCFVRTDDNDAFNEISHRFLGTEINAWLDSGKDCAHIKEYIKHID